MLKIELIQQIPFFAGLPEASPALEKLAQSAFEEKYEAGQLLFMEGEPCRGIYHLSQGLVRIYKSEPGGKEQILRMVKPGTTFNEVPVFDQGPVAASVEAVELSVVWIIPTGAIEQVLDSEPQVARAVIKALSEKLRHLTTLVGEISLKQVAARVARVLLDELEEENVSGAGLSDRVISQMTQQQMAALTGTVRDMVGRALRSMKQMGAIEVRRGAIIIKDPAKLQDFL